MEKEQNLLQRSEKINNFRGEPFSCWKKAKELRMKVYRDYYEAPEKGGLRAAGGAYGFMPLAHGLGDDVKWLSSEPYSASTGHEGPESRRFMDAAEAQGWARDLCGYMRNYWGTMILDEYGAFGGKFPKPDIILQAHMCCSHAKWYQVVLEIRNYHDVPFFCTDVNAGTHVVRPGQNDLLEHRKRYVADQLLDTIEEIDKVAQKKWGRRWDDETFIKAVLTDFEVTSLWAEICGQQKAIPAPMDEKSMFAFFNLAGIARTWPEVAAFYRELLDELKDRVARGIAAVPNERLRIFGDSPPPWAHLYMYRFLEDYGCVSLGSYYSFSIFGVWQDDESGQRVPRKTPQQLGVEIKTREQACDWLADWYLSRTIAQHIYDPTVKNDFVTKFIRQWNCDAAVVHLNRGCELTTLSAPELVLHLKKEGIPVVTYEGNMGDGREFDAPRVFGRIDAFMQSMGLKKLYA